MAASKISSFFVNSGRGGATFIDAQDVVLASITSEGNVSLLMRSASQSLEIACVTTKEAKDIIQMIAHLKNAMYLDSDAPVYEDYLRFEVSDVYESKAKIANQKLRDMATKHKIKAINACSTSTGMRLRDAKAHVEALLAGQEPSFGIYEKGLDLLVLEQYIP